MGATIKDVAKLAGTSTATVSKVMNGSYSISQETADKVRKAMEELDYHPNLRAKNFARQSARTIIFVAERETVRNLSGMQRISSRQTGL